METGIWDWVARQAWRRPSAPALVAGERRWDFRTLDQAVGRAAARLRQAGLGPGDRVAMLLPPGTAAVVLVYASLRLGTALVPVNLRLTAAEAAAILADAEPAAAVVAPEYLPLLEAAAPDLPRLVTGPEEAWWAAAAGTEAPGRAPRGEDLATLVYTSGTSGRAKGVPLTVANHWWNALGSQLHLGQFPGDRWLLCVPLYHVSGLSILYRAAISGAAVVVHPRFDPAAVWRDLEGEGITLLSVVPTMLQRLLDARPEAPAPASLRVVLLGGAGAGTALVEAARARGFPVLRTYGLTETGSQAATELPGQEGEGARPLFFTDLAVLDEAGRPLPPGSIGEIAVRGPAVTAGYWRRPEENRRRFTPDGWLRTGDVGVLAADGRLTVLDRRADLIISGGENIAPAEVEAVLNAHPAVAGSVVVGIPDPEWGQVPVAWAVPAPGTPPVAAEEVLQFAAGRLAGYKRPRALRWTPSLPLTANGKLRRAVARAAWLEGAATAEGRNPA
ncbi:MAG: o-succinylbenzoate--CoA ligase [Firmicutes bacterium]|nr:o-succinylbenzoate--CoA ligase [Bacillota bacterium]